MTTASEKSPTGRKDKKRKLSKDKNVTRGYAGKIAESIRRTLTYMKNLKVYPEVHKRLKKEAAEREVNIYDLTAAAITVGLDKPKDLERELTRQAAERTNLGAPQE
jgi:hypothetical protein